MGIAWAGIAKKASSSGINSGPSRARLRGTVGVLIIWHSSFLVFVGFAAKSGTAKPLKHG